MERIQTSLFLGAEDYRSAKMKALMEGFHIQRVLAVLLRKWVQEEVVVTHQEAAEVYLDEVTV